MFKNENSLCVYIFILCAPKIICHIFLKRFINVERFTFRNAFHAFFLNNVLFWSLWLSVAPLLYVRERERARERSRGHTSLGTDVIALNLQSNHSISTRVSRLCEPRRCLATLARRARSLRALTRVWRKWGEAGFPFRYGMGRKRGRSSARLTPSNQRDRGLH